jgi:hypothetical protein
VSCRCEKIRAVPTAEFEEKEYEMAFNIELAGRRGAVISSGQVLEKIVGYDAAARPAGANPIWDVLNVPRPRGVRLVQPHWHPGPAPDPDALPRRPVSLILQYKRPDFIHGAAAKQWHLWRAPYYRFAAAPRHQHNTLVRLERNLGADAVVRYAAPAFWRRADLEDRHIHRGVIAESGFVSALHLGRHIVWTYQRPGSVGRPNPRGPSLRFETLGDIADALATSMNRTQALVPYEGSPITAHVARVGAAATDRNPKLRSRRDQWLRNAGDAGIDMPDETLERVADIAAITTLMSQLGGAWFVVANVEALAAI